uniref:hypothetical protein n=1 Tax=Faecalibaculum rodentium TaxID=1702221 RepID=UPI00272D98EC
MYSKLPNVVFGFHGCHKDVFEAVLSGKENLKESKNAYDWLGPGIYFWESNLERAKQWAESHFQEDGRVLGAALDLGYCLNLTDQFATPILKQGYEYLEQACSEQQIPLPKNQLGHDLLLRNLDCAIISGVHEIQNLNGQPPFDSARGLFFEGEPIAEGSLLMERTHTQIAVRNPNCIKGYFIPRELNRSEEHT